MAITAHVYQIHVDASPEDVWRAITESEWTRRYFHTTTFVEPPVAGRRFRTVTEDGRDAIDGMVEEMTPPAGDRPGRFVQTWHVLYDADMAQEPPGRVEWTVEAVGEGLTRVRLVHGHLAASPLTWANVKDGWVWVLDAMKTLLETGRTLPSPDRIPPSPEPTEADWHREQGIEADRATLELLGQSRTPDEDEELLRRAYAAAYHWDRTPTSGPANQVRADYLVARALVATGQPERGLAAADRCLARCERHRLGGFDLAYAHEARARAFAGIGRLDEAAGAAAAARGVLITDPEDLALVEQELADLPG